MPEASSPQAPAILGAVLSVMDDVRSIDKNGSMSIAGSSYRFRKADDVVNAIGDAFRDHAVMLQSRVLLADHESYETSKEVTYKGNTETKVTRWTRTMVTMQYRFTSLVDGSTLDAEGIGEGLDSGDKSSSKAMTGALKYALTQALQIAFKDMADPDNERPETQDDRETDAQRVLRERREAQDNPPVPASPLEAAPAPVAEQPKPAPQPEQAPADPMAAGVETLKTELGAKEIDNPESRQQLADDALKAASATLAKIAKEKLTWKAATTSETTEMENAYQVVLGKKEGAAVPTLDLVNKVIIHAGKIGLLVRPFKDSSLAKHLWVVQQQFMPVQP